MLDNYLENEYVEFFNKTMSNEAKINALLLYRTVRLVIWASAITPNRFLEMLAIFLIGFSSRFPNKQNFKALETISGDLEQIQFTEGDRDLSW